jgi:catechol 2,3-dioxygenase-like lactoylglutathione lyase family enzyme
MSQLKHPMRFEGLTLTVESVARSLEFYEGKLGLIVESRSLPAFARMRTAEGGTLALLSLDEASSAGVEDVSSAQRRGVHVEFSSDAVDALYEELKARGVEFHVRPHDEPWGRSMTALDPDGYSVDVSDGKRGKK